ncbi:MAG: hypothetical protein ACFE8F_05025 [Promethearchaeota archaeon]
MRWFRRKKTDESESRPNEASFESSNEDNAAQSTLVSLTNPVQAFTKRLELMIKDPEIASKTKALKDTRIQLIIGGEPLLLSKKGVQPLSLTFERSTQSDVFIRISETAAGQLAMTSNLTEFKKEYKELVTSKDATSFVSIKLHTQLTELRNQGYFSVELLRILIDA